MSFATSGEGKKQAGYIRIAEDDSANATETVDADECFRHDCNLF